MRDTPEGGIDDDGLCEVACCGDNRVIWFDQKGARLFELPCKPEGNSPHAHPDFMVFADFLWDRPGKGIILLNGTDGIIVADSKGEYKAGYFRFGKEFALKNALWTRRGGLILTKYDLGCYCETSRFDIDRFDRLFVPDPLTFSILVLDTAGNRIARFGSFGNMDCRGKGSPVPEPEFTFGWATQVDCALGRVYVADLLNRRIVSVRFEHAASDECAIGD